MAKGHCKMEDAGTRRGLFLWFTAVPAEPWRWMNPRRTTVIMESSPTPEFQRCSGRERNKLLANLQAAMHPRFASQPSHAHHPYYFQRDRPHSGTESWPPDDGGHDPTIHRHRSFSKGLWFEPARSSSPERLLPEVGGQLVQGSESHRPRTPEIHRVGPFIRCFG